MVCEAAQVSKVHWIVLGEQNFPVRSDEAALEAISAALVPRTTSFTARPTAEFGTSAIASTFSWSIQRRAIAPPMSALFW